MLFQLTTAAFLCLSKPILFHLKSSRTTKLFSVAKMESNSNPLLQNWSQLYEFGLPPFAQIQPTHYENAFDMAFKENLEELQKIATSTEDANFENTIVALDRTGSLLEKVNDVFSNLCSSNGVPELQAVEMKMAGPLAAHESKVYTYPGLFPRIDSVYSKRLTLGLSGEQLRLVERFHLDFVRAGAKFDLEAQTKYAAVTKELAELCTQFTQNLLADESGVTITLGKDDLAGLPSDLITAARQAALDRDMGKDDEHVRVITLSRSLVVPFLTFSERRDLREKAWRLWTSRGELDPKRDNLVLAKQILQLRIVQANMHGYATFADYANADSMASSPDRVMDLLERVWTPAKKSFQREREALEKYIAEHVPADLRVGTIEPWDWRFYAEKVRQSSYNLDDSEVKPYFPLNNMVQGIFDTASQLFGLRFKERPDIVSYHPDVKTYEVHETDANGADKLVAIFLHDNYARPHKRSGAWMSHYRPQSPGVVPIICNNNNFNKGSDTSPSLLAFDDAVTLFHEFGHGLHGMLSNVNFKRLAGTNVLKDFVELPSQLYEHWLSQPEVLKKHARHYQTNEPIPDALLKRLMDARSFNQGFQTIEYTACALVDTAVHRVTDLKDFSMADFEKKELVRLEMPSGIVMRHRPAHFLHLFAGSSYAAGYYVYLWAEVLDADGFDAFLEAGGLFHPETAARVRKFIYSSGNSLDPAEAFRKFRGRDPVIEPMLKKKGLLVDK